MLEVGDPAPWFTLPSDSNPNYHFDTVAGHYVVMFFFGSSQHPASQAALNQFLAHSEFFRDRQIPFFGVSVDPTDEVLGKVVSPLSYCKLIWDFEGKASRMYGVSSPLEGGDRYQPTVFILNENLRVLHRFFLESETSLVDQVMAAAAALPPLPLPQMAHRQAPVLFIPNVFDRDFCNELIAQYHRNDIRESGFMRDIDGKTVEVMDYGFKRRQDWLLQESDLLQTINNLILRRIKPEIEKAYQYTITRFERHLIAAYNETDQGFFNAHRDNTTKGTAHRRFAMTLNLNTGEYEGGCLRFPEYGTQLYRPGVGEAVMFSCGLLHEVTPVTSGQRFVLLSFFYGEDEARIRDQNRPYVAASDEVSRSESEVAAAKPMKQKKNTKRGFQVERSPNAQP